MILTDSETEVVSWAATSKESHLNYITSVVIVLNERDLINLRKTPYSETPNWDPYL